MPDQVIFHIGMHKTGSSTIQTAFESYDDGRISYADLPLRNHSVPLVTAFGEDPRKYHPHRRRGRGALQISALRAYYRHKLSTALSRDRQKVILSAEDLCNLDILALKELKSFFDRFTDSYQVVGYVKEPVAFAESRVSEGLKHGSKTLNLATPNYKQRFDKFFELFGDHDVKLRPFNPSSLTNSDLLDDFASCVGAPRPKSGTPPTNVSLSQNACRILRRINASGHNFERGEKAYRTHVRAWKTLALIGGERLRLDPTLVANVTPYHDLQWLFDATGIDFRDLPSNSKPPAGAIKSPEQFISLDSQIVNVFDDFLLSLGIPIKTGMTVDEKIACYLDRCRKTEALHKRLRRRLRLRGAPKSGLDSPL